MLRGFRWQVFALLTSVIMFGLVLGFRFIGSSEPQIEQATETASPAPTFTIAPTFTPPPTAIIETIIDDQNTEIIFTEGIVGSVQRLNPLLIGSQAERDVTSLIFDGLVQINEFGEAAPDLAADWTVSRDGYDYVMQLRQDILWQDGILFTANDVIFTYKLLAEADFPMSEISTFWQTVEVEKLGDYLIRFRLAQPLASFPTLLTIGILPEHALIGTEAAALIDHPFNLSPIGTGAYQLAGLRSTNGQQIEAIDLQLAPTYQQGSEGRIGYALDQIRFHFFVAFDTAVSAFITGDIHALASRSMAERSTLLDLGSANIFTQVEPTVGMLIFNWNEGEETQFFSDLRVRSGLQLSLNRNNPIESVLFNQAVVADSPLRPYSWAYNNTATYPETNPTRAFELFDSANIIIPEDLDLGDFRYRFTILTPDKPALIQIAENIASQWSQYNFDVSVESVSFDVYTARLASGDFDTAIVEYVLGADPDVFTYWHADQYETGLNYGAVSDSRISEILERGRQTVDNSRLDIYRDFQVEFTNQAIAIPLYYPLYTYAVDSSVDGVQLGFISSQEDRFRTLQDWVFSTE